MSNTLKITLKANEKVYVNGAVIRADRKVSLEFLNDVRFLLEQHVLQPEDASTPLRQLYFIVQLILMNPQGADDARRMFKRSLPLMLACFCDQQMLAGLKHVDRLVAEEQPYEALKAIRALYALEARIITQEGRSEPRPLAAMAAGA